VALPAQWTIPSARRQCQRCKKTVNNLRCKQHCPWTWTQAQTGMGGQCTT